MAVTKWRMALGALGALGVLIVLAATLTGVAEAQTAGEDPALVRTDDGAVRGTLTNGYRTFEGIPYAAPPIADLRFRPPQPVRPWDEVLDATEPRQQCAQLVRLGNPETFEEDCLYLNVTTPLADDGTPQTDLPVMVWIHGGAFVYGTGANYDASKLATQGDVVVVTVNYRLASLGFLAHPALTAEDPVAGSGNYALEDQQMALGWVSDHVEAFGGDRDRVTIFGESAGAASVCANYVSPTAERLFDYAIAQSYSCAADYATLEQAEATGLQVAEAVGCADGPDVAACLREVPAEELLRAWPGGAFVVGRALLPLQPAEALQTYRYRHKPLMHGNLQDEIRLYVGLDPALRTITAEGYEELIRSDYGQAADAVLERYPVDAYPSPAIALATVRTDAGSVLSTCEHVDAYEAATSEPPDAAPVYAYQFQDRSAPPLVDFPDFDEGAAHASELPYLFPGLFGEPLGPWQEWLSDRMVAYWTDFAEDGDPNGAPYRQWPRYGATGKVLALAPPTQGGLRAIDVSEQSNCAFWGSLGG